MDQVDRIPERVAVLEEIAKDIRRTLDRLENRIEYISNKIDKNFMWLIGTYIILTTAQFAVVVSLLHH